MLVTVTVASDPDELPKNTPTKSWLHAVNEFWALIPLIVSFFSEAPVIPGSTLTRTFCGVVSSTLVADSVVVGSMVTVPAPFFWIVMLGSEMVMPAGEVAALVAWLTL